eukprot:TRINITY_DN5437_c0_g1_i1.p1 TRINITY_DN5437_c0_g1~~TRINITY_DN5437_c0_g1_i1.p1  ORF type:complete len:322 (-),score=52.46 TRINITY_DN5437_c0_g1_i1:43-1008(-)
MNSKRGLEADQDEETTPSKRAKNEIAPSASDSKPLLNTAAPASPHVTEEMRARMEANKQRALLIREQKKAEELKKLQAIPAAKQEVQKNENTTPLLDQLIDPGWKEALGEEIKKPYFAKILSFLDEQKAAGKVVYPPDRDVFNAFNFTPLDNVKVVILGQDPYHGQGQGHGLSFSVRKGVAVPPSLKNIFQELSTDIPGFQIPQHGSLEQWARDGVMLLNASLTVEASKANSHASCGWQQFTDAAIKIINDRKKNVVFILWGKVAQEKGKVINSSKHCVLKAAHPSPYSSDKFWGCKVFSKANEYLKSKGIEPVRWYLSPV